MSAEKVVTEREAVLREREAWNRCAGWILHHFGTAMVPDSRRALEREFIAAGERACPLPKVTRPREKTDSEGWTWRADNGRIEWLSPRGWRNANHLAFSVRVNAERVAIWADLLANPTEEVAE